VISAPLRAIVALGITPIIPTNNIDPPTFPPRVKALRSATAFPLHQRPMSASDKKRVLLIEDEPVVSILVAEMLDELGYDVVRAGADLKAAMEAARAEEFQVAVLDLAIEDGNTFPVAEVVHRRGKPFIFMTGLDISKAREKFAGTVVLKKPFSAQALQDALQTVESRMTKSARAPS
jgi:CheY-like chemotaxis protein